MKRIVFLLMFISVLCALSAQDEKSVSIFSKNGNILFIGINNIIEINSCGVKKDIIDVKITNGMIFQTTNGYKVKVNKEGSTEIIIKEYGKVIAKRTFECYRIPDPYPTVGTNSENCRGGKISLVLLEALSGIKANISLGIDLEFIVTEFTVTSYIKGVPVSEKSTSYKFTKKQLLLFRKTAKGGRLIIENIKAKGTNGELRKLLPLVFTII